MSDGLPDLPAPFAALRDHVLAHSVKRGDFTLKSGAKSTWFLDTKQTACRPDGIVLVADVTRVPRRMVDVSRASPASVVHASVGPGSPPAVNASPIARK